MPKPYYFFYILLFVSNIITGCSKSLSINNTQEKEERLNISMNPDPGNLVIAAFSDVYNYELIFNSAPPKNGVKVQINVTDYLLKKNIFSQFLETNTTGIKNINLEIKNLNPGILYLVNTIVTSSSDTSNKAYLSFQIARK